MKKLTGSEQGDTAALNYFQLILPVEKYQPYVDMLLAIEDDEERHMMTTFSIQDLEEKRTTGVIVKSRVKAYLDSKALKPVSMKQFVEDPYYMDAKGILYPVVLEALTEANNGEYQEALLTGAIGTAKSTIAIYSIAYQLYLLSCYHNPHALFALDPTSEILFIFQSINESLAKSVDYARFKSLIQKSEYFRECFPFDRSILSEMRFPKRIIVKPVSGTDTAALGQNVIGGIIDELNFMALIEKSRASVDGGAYDQAVALYNSIARRRKSRFMEAGKLPGLLCLVSSKRYPGQFTDQKEIEARRELELYGKTSIFVYDKKTWDIKPDSFSGNWFTIFIGDDSRKPRIMEEGEVLLPQDQDLIMDIPEEYRMEFENDIINALRDIAGVATLATHPFIVNREVIIDAVRTDHVAFSGEWADFRDQRVGINRKQFLDPMLPRYAHVDLALNQDAAGLCIGTVTGFARASLSGDDKQAGYLPKIWIDGALQIRAPKGGEILYYKIRELLMAIRDMGIGLRWVSFDSFQSVDSLQLLRQAGFMVGRVSMDRTTHPYDFTKNALYESRISYPEHSIMRTELASLERDVRKNKIDHPPRGSKDVSDALAGVVYGLTTRREIWAMYGVDLMNVPTSIHLGIRKSSEEDERQADAA